MDSRLVALLLVCPLAASCAAGRQALAPAERLVVMRGADDARMEVVKNDVPAGDVFLRTACPPVDPDDPALARLIGRMLATVRAEGGVGIAAPQVGVNRRVVLVQRLDREPDQPYEAYLNPEITDRSDETVLDWEGCLSIPAGFGRVRRAESIGIGYTTPEGRRVTEKVSGFVARIFQHEIDHLDGVLFIDRKEPGPLLPEEEYRRMRQREKQAASGAESTP